MTVIKDPGQFPGTQALPELVQVLLQSLFPSDELPVPAMAARRIAGRGARDLLESIKASRSAGAERAASMSTFPPTMTLEPLDPRVLAPLPHMIESSRKVVPEVLEEIAWERGTPPGFLTAHPTVQEMVHLLYKAPEERLERLLKSSTVSRGVTGHRPPKPTRIKAPEGFEFKRTGHTAASNLSGGVPYVYPRRDPLLKEMTELYRNFDRVQRAAKRSKWDTYDYNKALPPEK